MKLLGVNSKQIEETPQEEVIRLSQELTNVSIKRDLSLDSIVDKNNNQVSKRLCKSHGSSTSIVENFNKSGYTELHQAALNGDIEGFTCMLQNDWDANVLSQHKTTVLFEICKKASIQNSLASQASSVADC